MVTSKGEATGTYVALLRGINVGGKNTLPMKDLAALFTDAGCSGVRTYIQSGNVVFRAKPTAAKRVPELVTHRIGERFGFGAPVVLRTRDELAGIAANNPFLTPGRDPTRLAVMFLADQPSRERVAALDAHRSPPDEYVVLGRDIYLHLPNGFARTKLTNAYFDSKLATTSTVRNWRTVLTLLELANK